MNKKLFVGVSTVLVYTCWGSIPALADSECSSMAGNYNEGSHTSSAVERLGGGTLTGMNSASGGVYGTQGSSSSGWTTGNDQSTESGGPRRSGGQSESGGPLMNGGVSESNMHRLWKADDYTNRGSRSTSSPVSNSLEKQVTKIEAHVPVMAVKTYHWNNHRRQDRSFASRPAARVM